VQFGNVDNIRQSCRLLHGLELLIVRRYYTSYTYNLNFRYLQFCSLMFMFTISTLVMSFNVKAKVRVSREALWPSGLKRWLNVVC
jgi:hypothetical protein